MCVAVDELVVNNQQCEQKREQDVEEMFSGNGESPFHLSQQLPQ